MSHYQAFGDGDGDGNDEEDIEIQEGTEQVDKCTRRMVSKLGVLKNSDSPLVRQQLEDDHRKGNNQIQKTKGVIRQAKRTSRVKNAEEEFQAACTKFRSAFADYQKFVRAAGGSGGGGIHDDDDDGGGSEGAQGPRASSGSAQSLTLMMQTEDVDALLAREAREDALRLAQDTIILRDTMGDINQLIGEGTSSLGVWAVGRLP
jgi:hypothetical protein